MSGGPITLQLPPEGRWLSLAEEAVRLVCREGGLSEVLTEMAAGSLQEACEEYIRVARECASAEPFILILEAADDAVILQLEYSRQVPLNPQETEEYEVPDPDEESGRPSMDALWLHLIRKRMDRVRFTLAGQRCSLQMVKYRREKGKDRRFWLMGLAPALAPGVRLELKAGEAAPDLPSGALLQRADGGALVTLDSAGAFVVSRLDGKRRIQEIYMEYVDRVGLISPGRLTGIFEGLEEAGMLAGQARKESGRWARRLSRLLNPAFVFPQADLLVGFLYRRLRWLVGPFGVFLMVSAGMSGILPLWRYGDVIFQQLQGIDGLTGRHTEALLFVYLILAVVAVVHELGHALACKAFGGRVDRMGIMFYLAFFIFFCDVSSAWNFRERSARVWVSLAGPLTTFALGGLSAWAAAATAGSSPWGTVWALVLGFCLIGLVMNFNPFVKMDGYYILMDVTGVPNLRQRSFQFLKEQFLGRPSKAAAAGPRQKALFWVYGLLGALITVFFLLWPLLRMLRTMAAADSPWSRVILTSALGLLVLARLAYRAFHSWQARNYRQYRL